MAENRVVGRWCRAARTLAAAFALFAAATPAVAQDCSLKKMATFDIAKAKSGAVTIPVTLNGTPENMYLYLGGAHSELGADAAVALALNPQRIENGATGYTNSGKAIDHYVMISDLMMGQVGIHHSEFVIVPPENREDNVAGAIGPDVLHNFDVDLDFGAGKINLFSPDHCPGKVVYWTADYVAIPLKVAAGGRMYVPIELDGHGLLALLDVTSRFSALNAKTAALVYGIDEKSPGIERISDAKPDDPVQYRYRFKSLSLNGVEVKNPPVLLFSDTGEVELKRHANRMDLDSATVGATELDVPRFAIGLDVLTKLHVYMANGEKTLYLSAAGAGLAASAASH